MVIRDAHVSRESWTIVKKRSAAYPSVRYFPREDDVFHHTGTQVSYVQMSLHRIQTLALKCCVLYSAMFAIVPILSVSCYQYSGYPGHKLSDDT